MKSDHIPVGNPCEKCGKSLLAHRVEHAAEGDPCVKCGLPLANHRTNRKRVSTISYHNPDGNPCKLCGKPLMAHRVDHEYTGTLDFCTKCGLPRSKHRERERDQEIEYIGVDGEGKGRRDHKYTLLAASNMSGTKTWKVEPKPGTDRLNTEECLNLFIGIPSRRTKLFSFSFNYDLTMMLADLDDESLYMLFRPELRPSPKTDKGSRGPVPVKWRGWSLNLQGTKFTIRRGFRKVIIWDLFKFFQSSFVNAIKDWKVGDETLWARIKKMKEKRSEFDKESREDVLKYCLEECACIAELAHKLVDAHEKADLKLRSFYGAGSSGAAMLTAIGIKDKVRKPHEAMKHAVACAFSGGRFENSIIGQVEGLIYNRDISSAYPYHTTFLPCLVHGTWTRTDKRGKLDGKRAALVRYTLGPSRITTWGPFPFRTEDGSICYPIESGGGWVWLAEYLAAERIFPHVEFREAWVYETDCDCKPFAKVPEYYVLRLHIGKEGPGIVIKLGVNSIYGKLAQSIGNAIFNCWIWAGMVTSGCRAQVLDMLGLHKDWSNLLAVATDGIFTREKIQAPTPLDTGTDVIIDGKSKPLGGWEEKKYERGMFFARPGIYFPLNPREEEFSDIKGRGVGKRVILENWHLIMDAWAKGGLNGIATMPDVTRFCGAKTSISKSANGYKRAIATDGKSPAYGSWISRKVEMSFHPKPKRSGMNDDGTLTLRRFPKDLVSMPYRRATISREAQELMAATIEMMEQPDGDFTDYEME